MSSSRAMRRPPSGERRRPVEQFLSGRSIARTDPSRASDGGPPRSCRPDACERSPFRTERRTRAVALAADAHVRDLGAACTLARSRESRRAGRDRRRSEGRDPRTWCGLPTRPSARRTGDLRVERVGELEQLPLHVEAPDHRVTVRSEQLRRLSFGQREPACRLTLDREPREAFPPHLRQQLSPSSVGNLCLTQVPVLRAARSRRSLESRRPAGAQPSKSCTSSTAPRLTKLSRQPSTCAAISDDLIAVGGRQSVHEIDRGPRCSELRPHRGRPTR